MTPTQESQAEQQQDRQDRQEIKELLKKMNTQLERIETELKRVSKHVPFVDDLANSGVVRAVSKLNQVFSGAFLRDEPIAQLTDD